MARRPGRATVGRARARAGAGAMSEIHLDELSRRLGEVPVVDVRRPEEYDGSLGSPCDPRQGHIPGAFNFPVEELLALDEPELRACLGLPTGAEVVVYCHVG